MESTRTQTSHSVHPFNMESICALQPFPMSLLVKITCTHGTSMPSSKKLTLKTYYALSHILYQKTGSNRRQLMKEEYRVLRTTPLFNR
ncbi:hypothetical protein CY34DRAFT_604223 [Suillus luteus UH-Slu-Lm8-n1]|uniref:Uncharacterized protein n=1 Tax=Suillus luteus UH-Slu-Lm8-n1 TaxID=930992 RepID=A0A0C9ZC12_9AGAM|nr:hypothetical protein CY34DRAFT_604223 [Suillus luteus UH-Slu-Lm8-n1]